jgi:hypothetical protein
VDVWAWTLAVARTRPTARIREAVAWHSPDRKKEIAVTASR